MKAKEWYQALNNKKQIAPLLLTGADLSIMDEWVKELSLLLYCNEDTPPCMQCKNCNLILNTTHADVHIIEPKGAARKIPIELARQIPNWISRKSHGGSWTVIILKSADRLGKESANALLKSLEEPPDKTLIILMSDQHEGILSTILSRCQKINLSDQKTKPLEADNDFTQQYFHLKSSPALQAILWAEQVANWLEERKAYWQNSFQEEDLSSDQIKALVASKVNQEAENIILDIQQCYVRSNNNSENISLLDEMETTLKFLKAHVNLKYVFEYLALSQINNLGLKRK